MNKNIRDLTGQRFGKLVALKPTDLRKNGQVIWECRCDCGNTVFKTTLELTRRSLPSCGCVQQGKRRFDLTGQRFGKLLALRPTGELKWGSEVWECRCDCGKLTTVVKGNLISGCTQSCGCLRLMRRKAETRK